MTGRAVFLARVLSLSVICSGSPVWAASEVSGPSSGNAQSVEFGVHWPPRTSMGATGAVVTPLLTGRVNVSVRDHQTAGCTASLRILLSRASDEAGRSRWNTQLAFSEIDWMRSVRVWDADSQWLWPNLAYLLRLYGKERVDRYGGVDPGKGVDNDFAAVLIRKYDATGQRESDETKTAPLVAAEWYPVGAGASGGRTVVHTVQSDEFVLHLGAPGEERPGRAGIWLIYADFFGAKVPKEWPAEPEFAGGILAFFEAQWTSTAGGHRELRIEQTVPPKATGFHWERWAARTRAVPNSKRTAKLSDRADVSSR